MKFYLSSYKIGNEPKKLVKMAKGKIGYIPNTLDYSYADPERKKRGIKKDISELRTLGLKVELLDLKDYFSKRESLETELSKLGGVWIRGGNTFVLRQAMRLSGFDLAIMKQIERKDFLYGGYSAGICILAPNLKSIKHVDDPKDMPYRELKKQIWDGLKILDYMIIPHYKSAHPESKGMDKEVKYCKKNNIKFKTLRDGEVIIIDN